MSPLEIELLWLGYEGDETGLWGTPWSREGSARSRGGPTQEEVAEAIVRLASQSLIEVLAGMESIDFEDAQVVDPARVRELLEDPRAWRVAEIGEFVVRYRTTDAGFAVYREPSDGPMVRLSRTAASMVARSDLRRVSP